MQYGPPGPAPYGYPRRPTSTMAVITLVAGIAGLTILPVIASIVAVILGPIARKELDRTGEEGSGMITAGIITGWVGVGIGVLLLVLAVAAVVLSVGLAASFTA